MGGSNRKEKKTVFTISKTSLEIQTAFAAYFVSFDFVSVVDDISYM